MNTDSTHPEDPGRPSDPTGYGIPGGHGPGDPGAGRPGQRNFFDWIRAQGVARGQERWIGGVCSGLAQRFGVDPLIVRGIFFVLAVFAGIGVLLYGVAWALLPEPDGRIHAQEAGAGRWSSGMTGALITTIIGLPGLGRGLWGWGWDGFGGFLWGLFWVALIGLVIYVSIYYSRGGNHGGKRWREEHSGGPGIAHGDPYTAYVTFPETGTVGDPTVTGPLPTDAGTAQPAGPATAAWTSQASPLGAPQARTPRPPRQPRPPRPQRPPRPYRRGPGSAAVAITVGLALLVGGGLKALSSAGTIQLGAASDAVIWAVAAGVLGLGIVISGFRGRTSGFLGFLAVVTLIIGAFFSAVPHGDSVSFQNRSWNPGNADQARQGFSLTVGQGRVDLTSLGTGAPFASQTTVPVSVTMGNLTLVIPDNVPVQIRSDLALSNLEENGTDDGHVADKGTASFNTSAPGQPLIIQLNGALSNITVQEGSPR